jgi:CDP-paratose synthetase
MEEVVSIFAVHRFYRSTLSVKTRQINSDNMSKRETIMLTGGTGFLGSFVLRLLLKYGYKVIVITRPTSDMFRIADLIADKNLMFVEYTGGSKNKFIETHHPDYVIHTATCYGRNNESEVEIKDANFDLPLCLLKIGVDNGLKGFINTDTFFTEDLGLTGNERLYVKTKKDFLLQARNIVNGLKIVNLKLEQMYGPADNPNKFIPGMIQRLRTDEVIDLTAGEQKRDFVYVEDVAKAYVLVLENFKTFEKFEEFEIGTGKSHSIKKVMEILQAKLESKSTLSWGALPYRENELMDSVADIEKNSKIKWRAEVDILRGLSKTIEYYS